MQIELSSNKRIGQQLETILDSNRSIHAFIFVGGSKASEEELGMWFAKKLLCKDELSLEKFEHGNCADFIVIEKPSDRESIVKEQILDLIEKIQFKPFDDKYVILIKDAEKINEMAQNKLLKELEEPTADAIFIFLCQREDALLPTIQSRCVSFYLEEEQPDFADEMSKSAIEFAKLMLKKAPYYKKKEVISFIINDKDNAKELGLQFIDALELALEKLMVSGVTEATKYIKYAEKASMYLKQSFSVVYTLKQLCLWE